MRHQAQTIEAYVTASAWEGRACGFLPQQICDGDQGAGVCVPSKALPLDRIASGK